MEALLYLAKEGKVSGPFTPPQVEELKLSGEFYRYEWMWDGEAPDWSAVPRKLTSPPGLPAERTKTLTKIPAAVDTPILQPVKVARPFQGVDIQTSSKVFCAVLFDNRQSIGGEVTKAHSRGAHFVSTPSQTTPLSKGTRALVDLLDESNDRSTKIQATVATVSRMGDRWVLELEWSGCPLLDT
ncbi:MAG: hypothetical protein H7301_05270 [Cryobacterium sp.]|nr:hypothetical protein [Oligoflexia bacterium]